MISILPVTSIASLSTSSILIVYSDLVNGSIVIGCLALSFNDGIEILNISESNSLILSIISPDNATSSSC